MQVSDRDGHQHEARQKGASTPSWDSPSGSSEKKDQRHLGPTYIESKRIRWGFQLTINGTEL
jgi:hypothetical protein